METENFYGNFKFVQNSKIPTDRVERLFLWLLLLLTCFSSGLVLNLLQKQPLLALHTEVYHHCQR